MKQSNSSKKIKFRRFCKIIAFISCVFCICCLYGCISNDNPPPESENPVIHITYYKDVESSPIDTVILDDRYIYLSDSVTDVYGYTFEGLYTKEKGGTKVFDYLGVALCDINQDMTLYAQYTPWEYTITLDAGEGTIDGEANSFTAKHNDNLKLLPTPERYGYTFRGWMLKSGTMISEQENVIDEFTVLSGEKYETSENEPLSIFLIAVYDKIKLNVCFNYPGTDIPDSNLTVEYGSSISKSQMPSLDTGEKFIKGWSLSASEYIPYTSSELTENLTLYAFWTEYKSVALHRNDSKGTVTIKINKGDSFDLALYASNMTKEHHEPSGWFKSSQFSDAAVTAIDFDNAETDYYFKWTPKQYTISYDSKSAGKEIPQISYKYGEIFKLETLTKTGYAFDGWYKSSSLTGTPIKEINTSNSGSYTLYAGFSKKSYKISLNSLGGELNESSVNVKYSDSYTLPVPERYGYTFKGWYSSQSGGSAFTDDKGASLKEYTYDEGKTLYARWEMTTKYSFEYDANMFVSYGGVTGNYPASLTIGMQSLPVDLNYFIEEGYKCKITIKCKLTGSRDCKMTLKLLDGYSEKISSTNWDNKIIKGNNSYDFSYTFDISASSYSSSKKICFEFSARADGSALDVSNSYNVSDFEFTFEFYKA